MSPGKKPKLITDFTPQSTTAVYLSRSQVLRGLVQQVTVDGRPFELLNDTGFQTAWKPALDKLKLTVNSHNIVDYIEEYAKNLQPKIKVDAATCLDRSFLGLYYMQKSFFLRSIYLKLLI